MSLHSVYSVSSVVDFLGSRRATSPVVMPRHAASPGGVQPSLRAEHWGCGGGTAPLLAKQPPALAIDARVSDHERRERRRGLKRRGATAQREDKSAVVMLSRTTYSPAAAQTRSLRLNRAKPAEAGWDGRVIAEPACFEQASSSQTPISNRRRRLAITRLR